MADEESDPEEIFEVLLKIGWSFGGYVFKCLDQRDSTLAAVKMVDVEAEIPELMSRVAFLSQFHSPNLVVFKGSYLTADGSQVWIANEYTDGVTIYELSHICKVKLDEKHIACILRGALTGLKYLHENQLIHRDFRASNILIDAEGTVKLNNFGIISQLSSSAQKSKTGEGVEPFWSAPEILTESQHDTSADIWSLGITAIELADGNPPLFDIHPMKALFKIPKSAPPELPNPENYSAEFRDFVKSCLKKDPKSRPTAAELLQHKFITSAPSKVLIQELTHEYYQVVEKYRKEEFSKLTTKATSSAAEAKEPPKKDISVPSPFRPGQKD